MVLIIDGKAAAVPGSRPATVTAGTPAVIVMARVPVTVTVQMNVTDADRSDVTALPGVERTWLQLSQGLPWVRTTRGVYSLCPHFVVPG